jgi:hypothetical protein
MKKGGQTFVGGLFKIPLFGIPLEGAHILVVNTPLGAFLFYGETSVKHIQVCDVISLPYGIPKLLGG